MSAWLIEHKDGELALGSRGDRWVWVERTDSSARTYSSRQDANDTRELLPWRVKRDAVVVQQCHGGRR